MTSSGVLHKAGGHEHNVGTRRGPQAKQHGTEPNRDIAEAY